MAHLFEPLKLRDVTLKNRIAVSPMCEYSSQDGFANDWHMVHLGSRAVGGAGLVLTEATAVEPEGRISPDDLGIWKDEHIEQLAQIATFVKSQGSVLGMQLAHAGRKASTYSPMKGTGYVPADRGGWTPLGPSPIPFDEKAPSPKELTEKDIARIIVQFGQAAARALKAGLEVLEIHAAHGYLIHEFLSPISNRRNDGYGGPFENRTRLLKEAVASIRRVWPESKPLMVRLSVTDWVEPEGWTRDQSVELAKGLHKLGVDLVDCSSGGLIPGVKIPVGPGYQTPLAEKLKKEGGIATGAVGFITSPAQADHIIRNGQADMVFIAREFLRDPYFPLRAARELGQDVAWPAQYDRAKR
jgi:2,4-dienoyl-CoA reductase-like NADH-dependent reductase (Old Yellow Enzyme family)